MKAKHNCDLEGCNKAGVFRFAIRDTAVIREMEITPNRGYACCKTHMIRIIQNQKFLRYSEERAKQSGDD